MIGELLKNALIEKAVGNNRDNRTEDVYRVKKSLSAAGHFDERSEPEPHGYMTRTMDQGIRAFQKERGLRVDGYLLPGGETERELLKENQDKNLDRQGVFLPPRGLGGVDTTGRRVQEETKENKDGCSSLEVAFINAQAKLYIAKQYLARSERERLSVEQKIKILEENLSSIDTDIRREKGERMLSKSKGAVMGGSIGALVGSRLGGLAGSVAMAEAGFGVGSRLGSLIEETSDTLSDREDTDIQQRTQKAALKKEIDTFYGRLEDIIARISELSLNFKFYDDELRLAREKYLACKKN